MFFTQKKMTFQDELKIFRQVCRSCWNDEDGNTYMECLKEKPCESIQSKILRYFALQHDTLKLSNLINSHGYVMQMADFVYYCATVDAQTDYTAVVNMLHPVVVDDIHSVSHRAVNCLYKWAQRCDAMNCIPLGRQLYFLFPSAGDEALLNAVLFYDIAAFRNLHSICKIETADFFVHFVHHYFMRSAEWHRERLDSFVSFFAEHVCVGKNLDRTLANIFFSNEQEELFWQALRERIVNQTSPVRSLKHIVISRCKQQLLNNHLENIPHDLISEIMSVCEHCK